MHEYRDEELSRALSELPVPAASDDFFARLRSRVDGAPSRRRGIARVGALVVAGLLVGGFAGIELAGTSRGATSTPVPTFTPTIGWNTVETNNREAGTDQLDLAWAANVPFAPQDTQADWPTATVESLPAGAIVIVVVGPWAYTGGEQIPQLELPVRIENLDFERANWWEGQPAPNVSGYHISAHINAQEIVNVFVWMGSDDPTPQLKAAADEELARLMLPS